MQGAGDSIREGVMAVTVAPGVKAAKQKQVWLAKLNAAADKWATNVGKVTLGDWQDAMTTRGIANIQSGVTAKAGNYQAFAAKFFSHLSAGKATIDNMPKATLQDGINKAIAQIQWNAKYTGGNGRS
jgi:hypothetical protein